MRVLAPASGSPGVFSNTPHTSDLSFTGLPLWPPNVATAIVRRALGDEHPDERVKALVERADGSKRLEYPRQPEGWTNLRVEIGADGRMSALRQLLTPANFAQVQPGQDEAAVRDFGIAPENMFVFWDWVGGRFSVSSAIGLPVMLAIGPARFDEFLAGMRAMDEHAVAAPLARNLPVLLAVRRDARLKQRLASAWGWSALTQDKVRELGTSVLVTGALDEATVLMNQEIDAAVEALGGGGYADDFDSLGRRLLDP